MKTSEEEMQAAIRYAETIGVYEFKVKWPEIRYWSFFGTEGWWFVRHNLVTGDETRKLRVKWKGYGIVPKFLLTPGGATKYNYFTG